MDGRWTISNDDGSCYVKGYRTYGEVPVVPCDDAAMLRVRLAVQAELRNRTLTPAEIVEIAFRAAGETP